jgi:hypothetical protein
LLREHTQAEARGAAAAIIKKIERLAAWNFSHPSQLVAEANQLFQALEAADQPMAEKTRTEHLLKTRNRGLHTSVGSVSGQIKLGYDCLAEAIKSLSELALDPDDRDQSSQSKSSYMPEASATQHADRRRIYCKLRAKLETRDSIGLRILPVAQHRHKPPDQA